MKTIILILLAMAGCVNAAGINNVTAPNISNAITSKANCKIIYPGDDLQTAYDWLKSSDRDGQMGALDFGNNRTLLLTSGEYDLSGTTLNLDTDYVDVYGIGSVIITNSGLVINSTALSKIRNITTVDSTFAFKQVNYPQEAEFNKWVDLPNIGANFSLPHISGNDCIFTHAGTKVSEGLAGYLDGGFAQIAKSTQNIARSWAIDGEGTFIAGSDLKIYWISDSNLLDNSKTFEDRTPGGSAVWSTVPLQRSIIDCGTITGKGRVILFCVYAETGNRKIYWTTDFGATWTNLFALEGDCPVIKHFHGGTFIPGYGANDGRLFVFTGDGSLETSILKCDDVNDLIDNPATWYARWGLDTRADWSGDPALGSEPDLNYVVGYNGQKWRTVELLYDNTKYAYWAADAAGNGSPFYRIDVNSLDTVTIQGAGRSIGDGWFGITTSDGTVLISTSSKYYSAGDVNPYTAVAGYDNKVRLYAISTDGTEVQIVKEWVRTDYGNNPSGLAYINNMFELDGYIYINAMNILQSPALVGKIVASGTLSYLDYSEGGMGKALTDVPLSFNYFRNARCEQTEKYVRTDESFSGAGLNDLAAGGTYSGTSNSIKYSVEIDGTGTPDTFKWSKDDVEQTTGVNITGAAQALDNGITITFGATTGHTATNNWTFYAGIKPLYWNNDTLNPLSYQCIDTTEIQTGMTQSCKITIASNASSYQSLLFNIGLSSADKMFMAFRGRFMTFACDIKIAIGSDNLVPKMYMVADGVVTSGTYTNGEYTGLDVPSDGNWYTLYGVFFIPQNATSLTLGVWPSYGANKSGIVYINNFRLCAGNKIPNKKPMDAESFGIY